MGVARDSLGGLLLLTALLGCTREADENTAPTESPAETAASATAVPSIETNPARNAYFGDLHVHTMLSADAFIFGTRATPDDAYRYAKGEAIHHSAGFEMQLRSPLDFEAVTDHAAYLGMMEQMNDPATVAGKRPEAERLRAANTVEARRAVFGALLRGLGADDPVVLRSAWQRVV
jgi:predicted component of type VI protein secretion system